MRSNVIRSLAVLVAAGSLTSVAALPTGGSALAASLESHRSAGIVPQPGAGTAYGYSALIRHVSGPRDDQGKLVLLAPDGRSKTIGEVSDGAEVLDVSSNARTVVTGFWEQKQLRLTLWDTETGKPTYLRVDGGADAVLVKNGIVVSRHAGGAQLYSRTGNLLRAYAATGGSSLLASADGTRVVQSAGESGVVVRDVASGKQTHRVAVPAGRNGCFPDHQLDAMSFSMSCDGPGHAAPGESTAYRTGYSSAVSTTRLVRHHDRSGDARRVADDAVLFDAGAGTPAAELAVRDSNGVVVILGEPDGSSVSGAYGEVAYLTSTAGFEDEPTYTLKRVGLKGGEESTLAGPGSPLGGIVTSAKTVDGT